MASVLVLTLHPRSLRNAAMALLIFAWAGHFPSLGAEPVVITVHANQTTGRYQPVWNYWGADEPNYVYARNGEKLLHELAALSPVPVYFRAHNLLTTGTGEGSLKWGSTNVYTELSDGTPVYDWTITDRIFDALTRNGVQPLVEVGFMPEALSTHPQPYRHDFPRGDVFTGWSYPPRDYDKWRTLITAWVRHLHGQSEIRGWTREDGHRHPAARGRSRYGDRCVFPDVEEHPYPSGRKRPGRVCRLSGGAERLPQRTAIWSHDRRSYSANLRAGAEIQCQSQGDCHLGF